MEPWIGSFISNQHKTIKAKNFLKKQHQNKNKINLILIHDDIKPIFNFGASPNHPRLLSVCERDQVSSETFKKFCELLCGLNVVINLLSLHFAPRRLIFFQLLIVVIYWLIRGRKLFGYPKLLRISDSGGRIRIWDKHLSLNYSSFWREVSPHQLDRFV